MKMSSIADFVIAFFDLLEAEGRTLRKAVMRLGWGIACMLIAVLLVLAAAVFFLMGVYLFFASTYSPAVAAMLVSCIAMLLALITAMIAHGRTR